MSEVNSDGVTDLALGRGWVDRLRYWEDSELRRRDTTIPRPQIDPEWEALDRTVEPLRRDF